MPDIFRGIQLDPLVPANSFYLLWMILGYLVVTSVLIVSLGRLGDMVGRVRIYNLGFVIYTAASLLLAVDWLTGRAGATYLVGFRIVQGIGGACLLANAAAIITDAFPANQRGMALGINNIVGVSGIVHRPRARRHAGADRLAARVPHLGAGRAVRHGLGVPRLRELSTPRPRADRLGGQRDVRARAGARDDRGDLRHPAGRRASDRLGEPARADPRRRRRCLLVAFVAVERRSAHPMFRLPLFRMHAFTFGTLSTFLSAVARGGLMFMLDHLAAGHLAAAARLRVQRDAAVGGHLHAPADRRHPARGPALRLPVGPLRRAPVRHRGDGAAAFGFVLLALLPTDFAYPCSAPSCC